MYSAEVYSQHYFAVETKSWLTVNAEELFKIVRNYVIERSDHSDGDRSKISVISLSRI